MNTIDNLKEELIKAGIKASIKVEDNKLVVGYKKPIYIEADSNNGFLVDSMVFSADGSINSQTIEACVDLVIKSEHLCNIKESDWVFNEETREQIYSIIEKMTWKLGVKEYADVKQDLAEEVNRLVPSNAKKEEWNKAIEYAYSVLDAGADSYYSDKYPQF